MLVARIKVREMAKQIEEDIKDDEFIKFANAVSDFFYRATEVDKFASVGEELSKIIDWAAKNNEEKDVIIDFIDTVLKNLEKSWGLIVRSYGKLKIYSVSAPKFVRKHQNK